jgi:hypothetical protein
MQQPMRPVTSEKSLEKQTMQQNDVWSERTTRTTTTTCLCPPQDSCLRVAFQAWHWFPLLQLSFCPCALLRAVRLQLRRALLRCCAGASGKRQKVHPRCSDGAMILLQDGRPTARASATQQHQQHLHRCSSGVGVQERREKSQHPQQQAWHQTH